MFETAYDTMASPETTQCQHEAAVARWGACAQTSQGLFQGNCSLEQVGDFTDFVPRRVLRFLREASGAALGLRRGM